MAAVVLDADVLMAAADARDALHDPARDVLARLPAGRRLITAVTLLELLVAPARSGRAEEVERRLRTSFALEVAPVDVDLARAAATRRGARPALSPADALCVALASRERAAIASFDGAVRREAAAAGIRLLPRGA